MTGIVVRRRRVLPAIVALLVLCAGCAAPLQGEIDSPGANTSLGGMYIRYAHIAETRGQPHPAGADVPMFVWLYNNGPRADELVEVSTPAARSVVLDDPRRPQSRLPVPIVPQGEYVLAPATGHLTLQDLKQDLRGGDFVPVTFRFRDAGEVQLNVQVQPPPYDPGAWSPTPSPAPAPRR